MRVNLSTLNAMYPYIRRATHHATYEKPILLIWGEKKESKLDYGWLMVEVHLHIGDCSQLFVCNKQSYTEEHNFNRNSIEQLLVKFIRRPQGCSSELLGQIGTWVKRKVNGGK